MTRMSSVSVLVLRTHSYLSEPETVSSASTDSLSELLALRNLTR